ncbi:MAG: hypothetical protein QM831_44025 [Kofleriaceae bacterium]
MSDPTYKGQQATTTQTSWLSSLFGVLSPNYAGKGQPVTGSSLFGGATPAYKAAPVASATAAPNDNETACPIPSFAIVVPRPRCGGDATNTESNE